MQVAQYTFQSPSSTPVQVGRLDPSSIKEDNGASKLPESVLSTTATKAENFTQTQESEVKTTVTSHALDIYA